MSFIRKLFGWGPDAEHVVPPAPDFAPPPLDPPATQLQQSAAGGWTLYVHGLTGAQVRAMRRTEGGWLTDHATGERTRFEAGDYLVKPWGEGPRRVLSAAEFEAQFAPREG